MWALIRRHIKQHLIWVRTVCICSIYGILCTNRLDGHDATANVANYDMSAKSTGPDQTPHYAARCPIYGTLCLIGLNGHAVIANVANADISANSAGPDQTPHV